MSLLSGITAAVIGLATLAEGISEVIEGDKHDDRRSDSSKSDDRK